MVEKDVIDARQTPDLGGVFSRIVPGKVDRYVYDTSKHVGSVDTSIANAGYGRVTHAAHQQGPKTLRIDPGPCQVRCHWSKVSGNPALAHCILSASAEIAFVAEAGHTYQPICMVLKESVIFFMRDLDAGTQAPPSSPVSIESTEGDESP